MGFSEFNDLIHHIYRFNRVFSYCGFSGKHKVIRTIKKSIGNVSNFCTRRPLVLRHAFKHLSCGNHHFFHTVAFSNYHLLDNGYFINRQ